MTLRGPDIASYQAGLNLLTLPDADFYLVKATEGATYVDPFYPNWLLQANKLGRPLIWYHFVTVADSAAAQAANMAAHADTEHAGMLDIETEYGKSPTLKLVTDVIDAAHAKGLRIKWIYLPRWFWQDTWGSPDLKVLRDRDVHLISSNYPGAKGTGPAQYQADGGDDGPGWTPYGGMSPEMWQYTDAAGEQGQLVDYNAFRGTAAQLAALCGEAAPTGVVPSTTGWHRELTTGCGGDDVRAVQVLLTALGFDPGAIDGQFGQRTLAAVEHAQAAWNITKDGIVGPNTYANLYLRFDQLARPTLPVALASVQTRAVQVIQAALWLRGFDPAGVDGVFGAHTQLAVEAFQKARKIKVDGIVGPVTWSNLTATT
jgi:peptidoglycan hydrolase-like protein with peptidoglycan-binding domain